MLQSEPRRCHTASSNWLRIMRNQEILWHDGIGMSLYAKRLERGRFLWPSPADGIVPISAAQLAYMLDGIDWRMVLRARRGGTGSTYETLRGRLRRAIPFLLIRSGGGAQNGQA